MLVDVGYGTSLRVRSQARDSDGDRVGSTADVILCGWYIAPSSSTEDAQGIRDASTLQLKAYGGPAVVDINPDDRVYLDGEDLTVPPRWNVVGHPERWGNPFTGWQPGWVVTLQRVTG